MTDFLYRLFSAHSKKEYFFRQMGWADLLASLPMPQLKILRTFRIIRAGRLMREYGGAKMLKEFVSNRGGSALLSLIFLMLLILEFGGLFLLGVESRSPDANIKNASDVLWYIYVTVTTVGYGDRFPVTNTGRIIGVVILTMGVGLFGTLTAFLANIFIKPEESPEPEQAPASAPEDLKAQVEAMKQSLQAVEQTNAELSAKVDELASLIRRLNA
jgi:voltage-gated potassium channel